MKSMKKLLSKNILAFAVAIAMVCTFAIQPMTAFAADEESIQERISAAEKSVTELEWSSSSETGSKAHVSYYPSSGPSSGVFYGAYSVYPATYNNLPANKRLYFSYSVSGGGNCYLIFHAGSSTNGTGYWSPQLTADDIAHESYIDLPFSGTYTVEVYVPNNSGERIYAFNLYTK